MILAFIAGVLRPVRESESWSYALLAVNLFFPFAVAAVTFWHLAARLAAPLKHAALILFLYTIGEGLLTFALRDRYSSAELKLFLFGWLLVLFGAFIGAVTGICIGRLRQDRAT